LSNVYGKIASVYNDLSSYESAYKYQLKSVEISRKLNSPELPVNLINLGQVLDGSGKEKQATEFYREALKISHKYKNQHFIAVSSENLARNLTIRKKYKEATPYVEQSLTIYREMKNVPKIAAALGLSGKIYFNLGQYEKARIFVDEALSNKQNQKEKPELYLLHSLILEKQHKDSNALTSYKQYVSVKDSIQKIEDKQNTEALLVKYDTRLKDTQNELLTKDLKINQLKLSSQRSVILFLVIGLVLLILLLTALYKLFSSKKKTNRILATQKKELSIANIQLNEAINTKDKFFSILSHDLRDPVISMQSFGRMMSTKYDVMTEDERRELIEDNVKSSDGLFNLLEELLLWARCQTGVIYPVYEKIELGAFLSEVCRFYEQIAEQKGVLLKCSYQGTGKVRVDRSMLATILRNLISNAIKFSYLHQTVEVLCELKEKWIILSVKDEGEGMTKEELNRLFSITSNFTKSGTANEKGNGLGLIICYEFVHALHGEILVKSEKGKGATFTVKIPSGAIVEDLN
jgi:signal transduction histidine kinase